MPRYFHLLDDAELADTLWAFDLLLKHRQRLMEHWYSLYVLHFGAERTLAKDEFDELLTASLDRELKALRDLDMLAFSRAVDELGGELVRRGVGFAEVVVWTHLFEESCQDVLQADALTSLRHATVRTLLTLDKLSHVRMIVPIRAAREAGRPSRRGGRGRNRRRNLAEADRATSAHARQAPW